MGHVTYSDGVAIYRLVYYVPCVVGSVCVAWRHGFLKSSGWLFLSIFSVLRVIGAAAQIATIDNPNNNTAFTIALVCSVMGLSPLLMATLGLLSRIFYSILDQPWNMIICFFLVKIVHLPATIGLILCIVGATNAKNPSQIESESTVHIGVILFAVVFALLVLLELVAIVVSRETGRGEKLLVAGLAVAMPFIAVRLIYALLAAFSHDHDFDPVTGSQTVSLFMDTLMECAVVLVYIWVGLKLPAVPKEHDGSTRSRLVYRTGRGDFGTGRLGLLSLGAAILHSVGKQNEDEERGHTDHMRRPSHAEDKGCPRSG